MAVYVGYDYFVQALCNKEVDLFGTTDLFKAIIHSDAGVAATDDSLADLSQISGTGYTSGGEDIQNDGTRSGSTVTMTAQDVIWTATAGDWTSGRYVSVYDDTPTTPTADVLQCMYDYGSPFTVGNGETFTLDFGAAFATLVLS